MTAKKAKKAQPVPRERWSPSDKAQVYAAALGNPVWPLVGAAGVAVSLVGASRLGGALKGLLSPRAPVSVTVGAPDTSGLFAFLRDREKGEQRERASLFDAFTRREAERDARETSRWDALVASMKEQRREASPPSSSPAPAASAPASLAPWKGAAPGRGLDWRNGFSRPTSATSTRTHRTGRATGLSSSDAAARSSAGPAPGTTYGAFGRAGYGNPVSGTFEGAGRGLHALGTAGLGLAVGSVESVPAVGGAAVDAFGGFIGQQKKATEFSDVLKKIRLPEVDNPAFEVGRALPGAVLRGRV